MLARHFTSLISFTAYKSPKRYTISVHFMYKKPEIPGGSASYPSPPYPSRPHSNRTPLRSLLWPPSPPGPSFLLDCLGVVLTARSDFGFFFFKLWQNTHSTEFTVLITFRYTVQWNLAHSPCCATSPPSISRSLSTSQTETLDPFWTHGTIGPWQPSFHFLSV